jgi:hypothetical protein
VIQLHPDFAAMFEPWLDEHEVDGRLWDTSWYLHAAEMLHKDMDAAGIKYEREGDQRIDFHSFRALRITDAIKTGAPARIVMRLVRLSNEARLGTRRS